VSAPILQAPGYVDILTGVLTEIDPARAVGRAAAGLAIEGPCDVLAIGKAASGMVRGWRTRAPAGHGRTLVIVPDGVDVDGLDAEVVTADHPLPTERSLAAGVRIVEWLNAPRESRVVVLLSGGASALAVRPLPSVSLDVYRAVVDRLLRAGVGIHGLNAVRKRLDALKGGRLAPLVRPATVLIASDVVGDDPSTIASGPFSRDRSTIDTALAALARAGLDHDHVAAFVASPAAQPPTDPACFGGVDVRIVLSSADAVAGAARAFRARGVPTVVERTGVVGEARDVARALVDDLDSLPTGGAVVWGGETTVTVRGRGRGGRNQELALAAALLIAGRANVTVGSFGTDGVDGPTAAAGAIVTGATVAAARALGLDPEGALGANDSNGLFSALEGRAGPVCLVRTGPTGTNVGDVMFAVRE
jgi:glycerate 2-kinase